MNKDLLNDFDETGLDPENTVVRCYSQEEADIFLKYLHRKGVWDSTSIRKLSDYWCQFGSDTCYHISRMSWCDTSYYIEHRPEYCIINFCDIYKGVIAQYEEIDYAISFDEIMQFN